MIETDAIKLATLHLDEEAHEWWYHELVTLGHNTITSYPDFTQRLIEQLIERILRYTLESWHSSSRQVVQMHLFQSFRG